MGSVCAPDGLLRDLTNKRTLKMALALDMFSTWKGVVLQSCNDAGKCMLISVNVVPERYVLMFCTCAQHHRTLVCPEHCKHSFAPSLQLGADICQRRHQGLQDSAWQ